MSPRSVWAIVRLGLPIGLQYFLEGWAFQISTLLAGRLGEPELAAHTIALNLASLTFMIPMGLSFLASPPLIAMTSACVGTAEQGVAKALNSSFRALAEGIGPLIFGGMLNIFARTKFPSLPWLLGTTCAGCAGAIAVYNSRRRFDRLGADEGQAELDASPPIGALSDVSMHDDAKLQVRLSLSNAERC